MTTRVVTALIALVVLAAGMTAFLIAADGDDPVCAPIEQVTEPGGFHVLPGTEVTYELSPPTSGPHLLPGPDGGVYDEPIDEARQVSVLEVGNIMLQYSPAIEASDLADLEALASAEVVVAPAVRAMDRDATVAFTAWGVRQRCTAMDVGAAEAFIDRYQGAFFVNH